jgi:hypothetical protein
MASKKASKGTKRLKKSKKLEATKPLTRPPSAPSISEIVVTK